MALPTHEKADWRFITMESGVQSVMITLDGRNLVLSVLLLDTDQGQPCFYILLRNRVQGIVLLKDLRKP